MKRVILIMFLILFPIEYDMSLGMVSSSGNVSKSLGSKKGVIRAGDLALILLQSNNRDTVVLQRLTVKEFKDKLAQLESITCLDPYSVVNQFGFKGKYQVSNYYIRTYTDLDPNNQEHRLRFLSTPIIQEHLMNRLCVFYLQEIHRRDLDSLYVGKTIDSVRITLEGLMAGYHQHPAAMLSWLRSGGKINIGDGNNTPVRNYIAHYQ